MTNEELRRTGSWRFLLARHWHQHETLRFLVVGAGNTALGYSIFVGTYVALRNRVHYLVILVLAHLLSVCCAFLAHKFLTFRVRGHFLADFLRFNLTYLGSLAVGMVGLPLLVEVFRIRLLVGQAILVCLTTVGSYLLHKRVSFHRP